VISELGAGGALVRCGIALRMKFHPIHPIHLIHPIHPMMNLLWAHCDGGGNVESAHDSVCSLIRLISISYKESFAREAGQVGFGT
jgi:hypothetical protein